jgi:hypothetical protein
MKFYQSVLFRKPERWKVALAEIVTVAIKKLERYDPRTKAEKRELYNYATLLDPRRKLDLFHRDKTSGQNTKALEEEFRKGYAKHYGHFEKNSTQQARPLNMHDMDFSDLAASWHRVREPQAVKFS